MIPKKIHQIHIGPPMSAKIAEWTASFSRLNPSWEHLVWDETMLAAVGIHVGNYSIYGPSAAGITNFLRLELIDMFGGLWADTDCECLKPLDPLLAYSAFAAEQDHEGGAPRYCNAFFGAEKGHPWIRRQIQEAEKFASADATWGVHLMTSATKVSNVTIIPKSWCYPWLWHDAPEKRVPASDSLVQHFWAGSWHK